MHSPSRILGPLLLLLSACDGGVPAEVPPGFWGGDAVLTVGGDTSRFVSGCLLVSLPSQIVLDDAGRFSLPVTLHWIAPVDRSEPGRVDGHLARRGLTLTLAQDQAEEELGTFLLKRGAPIPVDGCMLVAR